MISNVSIQRIWETSKIIGVEYYDVLMQIDGMCPTLINEFVRKCEDFGKTVSYPHKTYFEGIEVYIETNQIRFGNSNTRIIQDNIAV